MRANFAAMLDGHAVRYDSSEAWVLNAGIWVKADLLDVNNNASIMGEPEFLDLFGKVPTLPEDAFAAPTPSKIEHRDRNGPLSPDSWDSDPTK
jgi:hypothetical protein